MPTLTACPAESVSASNAKPLVKNCTVPPALAGVTADIDAQVYWGMGYLDWDRFTTKPSKAKLLSLGGMDDVAKELWP